MKKRCTLCGRHKNTADFNRNSSRKDGLQNFCRRCGKRRAKGYYKAHSSRMKEQIAEAKRRRIEANQDYAYAYLISHPCIACGEADPLVLDFDHVRGKKVGNVSVLVRMRGLKAVQNEIQKCDVRCANCHRRKTAVQNGSWLLKRVDSTTGVQQTLNLLVGGSNPPRPTKAQRSASVGRTGLDR